MVMVFANLVKGKICLARRGNLHGAGVIVAVRSLRVPCTIIMYFGIRILVMGSRFSGVA